MTGWQLIDAQLLEMWRSVMGPHAELNGPLIRFAALVRAEARLSRHDVSRGQVDAKRARYLRERTGDAMTAERPDCDHDVGRHCLALWPESAESWCPGCLIVAYRALEAERDELRDSPVLQAVLDAIKGTLDPSTQIADHPNVKFAQMQRLDWVKRADVAEAQCQALRAAVERLSESWGESADWAIESGNIEYCQGLTHALDQLRALLTAEPTERRDPRPTSLSLWRGGRAADARATGVAGGAAAGRRRGVCGSEGPTMKPSSRVAIDSQPSATPGRQKGTHLMLLTFAKKQLAAATQGQQTSDLPIGSLTGQPALYAQPRYGEVDGIPVYVQGESNMQGFSPVSLCTEIATGETAWISTGLVHGRRLEPFTPGTTSRSQRPAKAGKTTTPATK